MKRSLLENHECEKQSHSLPSGPPLASTQIALRLGLAFSLLVALLIAVGDLGLHRMDHVNADLQDIMGRQWVKLRLAREAATYSNRNSRITMEIFLVKDRSQIDSLLAARAENTVRISALVIQLRSLCRSEEEQRLLRAIEDSRGPYVQSYGQALHLLTEENKRDVAVAVMVEQTTPALLKYHDAWSDFLRCLADQLELAAQQSAARYAIARRFALFMIALAVVVAGLTALFATRRMVLDITARLGSEQETLRTAHQEAEIFINAVPSILIGLDHQSNITRWNSAATAAFGLLGAEMLGKNLTHCGIKWLRGDMADEIQSWCSEHGSRRCDPVPYEMHGETRLLGLTVTSLLAADGRSTELLVIGSDITERTAMEVQLRQAQKLESVGQLAAGIAHEINTPTQYIGDNVRFLKDSFNDLTGVLGGCERLFTGGDFAPSSEAVQQITAAVKTADIPFLLEEIPKAVDQAIDGVTRISTIVAAMKEFSHPDTKDKVPLDLNHAIQSTITVARSEWKYVADLKTDFDPSLPPIICLPGEFNQVILNLIVNATHAIAAAAANGGPAKGTITVRTRNLDNWAEISIQDTGTGIPEKVRPRIFDPFFTTKEIGKGTGQGLAIARSVVMDKHNGTIDFETEEGKGTTFIVRLPHDAESLAAKAGSA